MSSKVGAIGRSLGRVKPTTPWRDASHTRNTPLRPYSSEAPAPDSPQVRKVPSNEKRAPVIKGGAPIRYYPNVRKIRSDARDTASQRPEVKDLLSNSLRGSSKPKQLFRINKIDGLHKRVSSRIEVPAMTPGPGRPKYNFADVDFDESFLQLELSGQKAQFDYTHLRDSCPCDKCVDPSTKQRNIQTSQIPATIQPRSYVVESGNFIVQWKNDIPGSDPEHTSVYTGHDLKVLLDRTLTPSQTLARDPRVPWDRELFETNVRRVPWEGYINDEAEFARCMRDLSDYGLVILSGVPESRDMVEKVATRMGPLRNSFYGETWDVRSVQQPKNVAYTDQFLNFHMDLLYMRDPPGYQLLHCLRNSCSGGESLFSDGYNAAKYLYAKDRAAFRSLSSFPVNYGYKNMDQDYRMSRPTFELPPEHGNYNHTNIEHINYSPPFQAPFRAPRAGGIWHDKYREYIKSINSFAQVIESPENMYQFKLDPGDCVIFENRRVVHARRAFDTTSGERWLAGAYVDEDAVRSKFRVLESKYPRVWNV
ncbi:hypothetical protein FQN54_009254 [Arachnomyces sp. PD_36]|nr:hypothetical protein FQN54_009254 [Arachnomyces sp. PD_36]